MAGTGLSTTARFSATPNGPSALASSPSMTRLNDTAPRPVLATPLARLRLPRNVTASLAQLSLADRRRRRPVRRRRLPGADRPHRPEMSTFSTDRRRRSRSTTDTSPTCRCRSSRCFCTGRPRLACLAMMHDLLRRPWTRTTTLLHLLRPGLVIRRLPKLLPTPLALLTIRLTAMRHRHRRHRRCFLPVDLTTGRVCRSIAVRRRRLRRHLLAGTGSAGRRPRRPASTTVPVTSATCRPINAGSVRRSSARSHRDTPCVRLDAARLLEWLLSNRMDGWQARRRQSRPPRPVSKQRRCQLWISADWARCNLDRQPDDRTRRLRKQKVGAWGYRSSIFYEHHLGRGAQPVIASIGGGRNGEAGIGRRRTREKGRASAVGTCRGGPREAKQAGARRGMGRRRLEEKRVLGP
jgi:hypothetical protein